MRYLRVFTGVWLLSFVTADWPVQTYRTETFTSPTFSVNKTGNTPPDPGYLFLGIVHPIEHLRGSYIVTDDGELIWHGDSAFAQTYNFQSQTLNDTPILSWWSGELSDSHGYGSVILMDQHYQQIHEVCLPEEIKQFIKTPRPYTDNCLVDKHESIMTNTNSIIVTGYNATQTDLTPVGGPKDGWVYDCLFYELEIGTNNVLFQWSALKHVPITASNFLNKTAASTLLLANGGTTMVGLSQEAPWDFFHINSVEKIEGGYLVNSRYTWSFYFIGLDGHIQYTIEGCHGGDFKFNDSKTFFSFQHNARLRSMTGNTTTVSIFNNDNFENPWVNVNASTGYLFTLDTTSMTAATTRLLENNTYGPTYAVAEGSYQELDNGHVLLGYGVRPLIKEFDSENNEVYSAQFSQLDLSGFHTYRAYRLPWVATPKSQPKLVADIPTEGSNNVTAFMSWNGATNYTSWNIMVGPSNSTLHQVASQIPKNGFETKFALQRNSSDEWSYVKVEALDSQGNVLANSTVVEVQVYTPSPTPSSSVTKPTSGARKEMATWSLVASSLFIQIFSQVLI